MGERQWQCELGIGSSRRASFFILGPTSFFPLGPASFISLGPTSFFSRRCGGVWAGGGKSSRPSLTTCSLVQVPYEAPVVEGDECPSEQ